MRYSIWILGVLALAGSGCTPDTPATDGSTTHGTSAAHAAGASGARRVVVNGVDLTGIGYDRGARDAPIVMVDLSDFACPFCGSHARQTLPALEREFITQGKVFYKYVPIVMGFPNGDRAARAAECAAEQDAFWPMHDRIYADQAEWKRASDPAKVFARHATSLGLDTTRFGSCYASARGAARTDAANDRARRLGVRATPTFFVNGQMVEGALPLDRFRVGLTGMLQAPGR
ncbi:MAG TPA: thioredoxin domain-containing protein [Gemmatimonadales bacterium]|nr:thioredoxin domain-containing protein [Gemmatimonadales bacterium]